RAYRKRRRPQKSDRCRRDSVCLCPYRRDDVNAVIQLDVEAQDEFYQLIAKAEARVQALASSSRNSQFLEAAE
ncbi:hypothetical protein ACC706_37725, partial [Rhizobium johnstonii]